MRSKWDRIWLRKEESKRKKGDISGEDKPVLFVVGRAGNNGASTSSASTPIFFQDSSLVCEESSSATNLIAHNISFKNLFFILKFNFIYILENNINYILKN